MRFSIITPCFNAEAYIADTVRSVLNQSAVIAGDAELEYIVVDGGSTDRTVEIVEGIGADCISIITEPDQGMYDAVAKGLERASGDVVAYLNAGDLYFDQAFSVLIDVFEDDSVEWVTGVKVIFNDKAQVIRTYFPFRYKRELLAAGCYGTHLPFVMQECTFWRGRLLSHIDYARLRQFRLAGDSFLWHCFSRGGAELFVVNSLFGGHRKHAGQLSSDMDSYLAEMRQFSQDSWRVTVSALFERLLWPLPNRIRDRLGNKYSYSYHLRQESWAKGSRGLPF